MTLDEFMDSGLRLLHVSQTASRRHITQPGFLFLYLKLREGPVLDITTVTVLLEHRGKGLFTKTLRNIKYKYPDVSICIETSNERFRQHLLKLGFETLNDPFNLILPAQKDIT